MSVASLFLLFVTVMLGSKNTGSYIKYKLQIKRGHSIRSGLLLSSKCYLLSTAYSFSFDLI